MTWEAWPDDKVLQRHIQCATPLVEDGVTFGPLQQNEQVAAHAAGDAGCD